MSWRLSVALELVGGRFRFDAEYCVLTVVPSLVVWTVSAGVALNLCDSGKTLTGSDAPSLVFSATSLGVLYVVVTVVPSLLTLSMPPFGKGLASGKSSMGVMFTGSDA